MFVVPLAKDIILTKDGVEYKVVEYTNYKDIGPAVYAKLKGNKELSVVYFVDIEKINKTKVEYQKGSKIFLALGNLNRKFDLPQPDDNVLFAEKHSAGNDDVDEELLDVQSLKLKSKSLGTNKGLMVKCSDDNYYRLKHLLNLKPALMGNKFNRDEYMEYYKDYLGV